VLNNCLVWDEGMVSMMVIDRVGASTSELPALSLTW